MGLEKHMKTGKKQNSTNSMKGAVHGKWLMLGALTLMLGLVAPFAVAGPEQDNEQAVKEFNRGDLVASMALWRKAANAGYAPAQVWLGDVLDKSEEDQEAVEWYRKAAAQGDVAGEFGLGQMYAKGEGVKKDLAEARAHILRAAEKNHLPAMMVMMGAYRVGSLGVIPDAAQADAWEAKLVALSPTYKKEPVSNQGKPKKVNGK
jgi:uncharacterized protein